MLLDLSRIRTPHEHVEQVYPAEAFAADREDFRVAAPVSLAFDIFKDASHGDHFRLAGRTHRVISGVALVDEGGAVRADEAVTEVTFRPLDDAMIEWYLGSREWDGRAGGYAIQGRGGALVERIDGDYLNVVGLPVGTLLGLWPGLLDLAAA